MRPDIGRARNRRREHQRAKVVEKDEWAHHAASGGRQDPADPEPAQVTLARRDQEFDHFASVTHHTGS